MKKLSIQLPVFVVGIVFTFAHHTPPTLSSNPPNATKILKKVNWGGEPVDITDVRINGKPVSFERSYKSNDGDWIHELSVKVRNATDKRLCLKSPKSLLETVSTGSGSDLVNDGS